MTTKRLARGPFLTALLLVMGAAMTLASLALIFIPALPRAFGSMPDWFNAFVAGLLLARLVALAAIWYFKRWGAYLLALLESLEMSMGLFVFTSVLTFPLRLIGLVAFVLVIAVWVLALRPKWQAFT